MRKIQILGTGCPKCAKLAENAQAAAEAIGVEHTIEKVTDVNAIAGFGVFLTPALAIDGEVKASGEVPARERIEEMLR